MIGATAGASPKIIMTRLIIRWASGPSKRSRMIVRPMIVDPPAESPCSTEEQQHRQVGRKRATHAGHGVCRERTDYDRLTTDGIGQRPVERRHDGEANM